MAEWLTESEVIERVGCSARVLRIGAARGQLSSVVSVFTGEAMYDATQVERLARLVTREIVRQSR